MENNAVDLPRRVLRRFVHDERSIPLHKGRNRTSLHHPKRVGGIRPTLPGPNRSPQMHYEAPGPVRTGRDALDASWSVRQRMLDPYIRCTSRLSFRKIFVHLVTSTQYSEFNGNPRSRCSTTSTSGSGRLTGPQERLQSGLRTGCDDCPRVRRSHQRLPRQRTQKCGSQTARSRLSRPIPQACSLRRRYQEH